MIFYLVCQAWLLGILPCFVWLLFQNRKDIPETPSILLVLLALSLVWPIYAVGSRVIPKD